MSAITLPTAEDVRKRLDYDPATGVFLWLYCDAMPEQWNARYAGKVAGTITANGYRQISIDGRPHQAHRLAWLMMTGDWPNADIDHVNGNRADNRIANLRDVDRTENLRNAAMPLNNTSGHMGVTWDKAKCKWRAQIVVAGRTIHLGRFDDIAAAIAARAGAETAYGFHPNHGRGA